MSMNDFGDLKTLWELFLAGGPLMWPITVMSFLVVAFGLERLVALRRGRFVPRALVEKLRLIGDGATFEPREVGAWCDAHPSVLATVVRALLARLGRPLPEVEHAIETTENREASRMYANIRPISLAVTITPLLGLLGTVQGMIIAFYTTANLQAGANRAAELASGIYLALITTFAGLCVAIPAAVIAHYLEGRILAGFRRVDDVVTGLLPAMEAFGKRGRREGAQRTTDRAAGEARG
jgi:biopolymer transport protein ExbB